MLYSDTCIQTLPSSAIRINLMLVKVPWASQVVLDVKNLSANAGGWGRTHGGRNGNLLQYSCLEHPMDRGAWPAIDHGVTKSLTRMKQPSTHTSRSEGATIHFLLHLPQSRDHIKMNIESMVPKVQRFFSESINWWLTLTPLFPFFCLCNIYSKDSHFPTSCKTLL